MPVNRTKRCLICRLHTDFQLHQTRPEACQKFQFILSQNIGRYLKMKICDTIVMFFDVLPDSHGMPMIAVKGTVNKLDLRHLMIQKKLQFLLYQLPASKPHRFVDRRQTITAPKRTAPARLIIDDPVLKAVQIFIIKRKFIHGKALSDSGRPLRQIQPRYFPDVIFLSFMLPAVI